MKEIDLIKEWIASDVLEEVLLVLGYEAYERAGVRWPFELKVPKTRKVYSTVPG
jgi:hypothetical protein